MNKTDRKYLVGEVVGTLVYSPCGRRTHGFGKHYSHEFNYTLYVRDKVGRHLFSESYHNPSIKRIKQLLETISQSTLPNAHDNGPQAR